MTNEQLLALAKARFAELGKPIPKAIAVDVESGATHVIYSTPVEVFKDLELRKKGAAEGWFAGDCVYRTYEVFDLNTLAS